MYGSIVGRELRKSSIIKGEEDFDRKESVCAINRHLALALADFRQNERNIKYSVHLSLK